MLPRDLLEPAQPLPLGNMITEPDAPDSWCRTIHFNHTVTVSTEVAYRVVTLFPIENLDEHHAEGALPEFACCVHLSLTWGVSCAHGRQRCWRRLRGVGVSFCSPRCMQQSFASHRRDFCAKASGSLSPEWGLGFDFPSTRATRHDRVITKVSLCRISIENKTSPLLIICRVLFRNSPNWWIPHSR
jgi:hypothetical protein